MFDMGADNVHVNIAATAQDVSRKSLRDNLRPAEPSTGNLLI